ncbi:MAG: potassium channel protein [Bacteroidales bacterium]|nr:potassium channel protein [Bacteroidales bacterium]HPO64818.1 potassium channel protein [Bacteroidales bacterium]
MRFRSPFKKIYIAFLLLLVIIGLGVTGFMWIEKYNFIEAFFMTIITIATVGFTEVHPLSETGMIFTSFLIIVSFGIFAYVVAAFTEFVVEGIFQNYYLGKKMQKKIDKLSDHIIVCGYGRNGSQATKELLEHGIPVVVIELDPNKKDELIDFERAFFIEGDATHDEVLLKAGIERARAIITVLPNDAENVFLVLTARQLNPKISIISKASDDSAEIKLRRAGANSVILPDKMSGRRMARMVAKPDIVEFIDILMQTTQGNVVLDEVPLEHITDYFNGRTLRELEQYNDTGARIVGIKQQGKTIIVNPLPEITLSPRDKLFVIGTHRQIQQLKELIANPYIKG